MVKLGAKGDPHSKLNSQRRLQFLREQSPSGVVFIPESWVKADPALERAARELDWLQIETPQ